ncbi:MAG: membrane protein insertion efficiency factor YidD [Candidatus Omnitrophica bacterium]|nr:membrane protein insertion efficiency factor YidD [Candidatus Omnitrophota bacterium]
MKKITTQIIRLYQQFFSQRSYPHCRHFPSCSEYAVLAVEKHGAFFGTLKTLWRLLRCNPFSRVKVDLP